MVDRFLSLPLTHIQRSDIDCNMAPLSHSLTSWQPAGALRMIGHRVEATKEAAVTAWTIRRGLSNRSASLPLICVDLEDLLWGHLPQMTD